MRRVLSHLQIRDTFMVAGVEGMYNQLAPSRHLKPAVTHPLLGPMLHSFLPPSSSSPDIMHEIILFSLKKEGGSETRGELIFIEHLLCTRNNVRTMINIFSVIATVPWGQHHLHFSDGETGTRVTFPKWHMKREMKPVQEPRFVWSWSLCAFCLRGMPSLLLEKTTDHGFLAAFWMETIRCPSPMESVTECSATQWEEAGWT